MLASTPLPSPPLRWQQRRALTTIDGPRGARRCPSLDPRRRGPALSLFVAVVLHLPCVVVPLHLIGVDSEPSLGEGSLPSILLDLDEGRGKAQKGLPQQIRPSNLGWVWRCCLLDRAFDTTSSRWNPGFVETVRPAVIYLFIPIQCPCTCKPRVIYLIDLVFVALLMLILCGSFSIFCLVEIIEGYGIVLFDSFDSQDYFFKH